MVRGPVSRILCAPHGAVAVAIHLCGRPGIIGRATRSLLGLAPGGVYRAVRVARTLVRSYRTVSPLPVTVNRPSAVCSLLHFPSSRLAWQLPSTLPCGVRTFLSRRTRPRPPGPLTVPAAYRSTPVSPPAPSRYRAGHDAPDDAQPDRHEHRGTEAEPADGIVGEQAAHDADHDDDARRRGRPPWPRGRPAPRGGARPATPPPTAKPANGQQNAGRVQADDSSTTLARTRPARRSRRRRRRP